MSTAPNPRLRLDSLRATARVGHGPTLRIGAFSMLELMIALAIFAVIGGALFQVMDACLRTTSELHDMQRFTRQVASYTELCRKGFATLSADATMVSPVSEEVDGQELRFRNAPSLFAWGATPMNYGTTTLAVRPQEDGLFSLSLSRSDFKLPEEEPDAAGQIAEVPELEPDEHGRYWLPLIADLEWARWRFYDPRQREWQESWPHSQRRPTMMELTLMIPGDTVPYRAVFRLATASTPAKSGPAQSGRPAKPAQPNGAPQQRRGARR